MSPHLRTAGRIALPVLAAAAFALGCIGYAETFATHSTGGSATDVLYGAIRLFFFESDGMVAPPWPLDVARFLAPAVTAVGAISATLALFRNAWDRRRLQRARDHVVVCGAGAKGAHLASEFLATGDTVVVVEREGDKPEIAQLREAGALVVLGDMADPRVLEQARVGHARIVVSLAGADDANVAVAAHARVLSARTARPAALLCLAHVVDPQLRMMLKRQRVLGGASCSVRLIDTFALAARRFLAEHPLENGMQGPLDPRPVHLVVLGLGTLGRALVIQAIRTGHYANLQPLHVTVVDRRAEEKYRQLLWLWPHLPEACRLEVIEGEFEDPRVRERLRTATAGEALLTVAICVDDDARAVTVALRVLEMLQGSSLLRLAVRLGQGSELAGLLGDPESADGMPGTEVVVLGTHAQALHRDELLGNGLDTQARAVHQDYVRKRLAEGADPSESMLVPWEQLPADVQDSNRQQADHIAVKLRAVNCRTTAQPPKEPLVFSMDEVELLARMEHTRWVAERILAGWTLGPKDKAARRSPSLVAWEALPEGIRELDREPVRNIPALLAAAGLYIERVDGPTAQRDKPSS
jgi:hypothetical protein